MAATTVIDGIVIPSASPLFLSGVAVHVVAGIVCVVAGAVAMLSRKARGRHSTFGSAYFWGLCVVCVTAGVLAAMRWAEDAVLFGLAVVSFGAAFAGRAAIRGGWRGAVRRHIAGMGFSYIVLLTAFYVDNGKTLPLWRDLPPLAYWLVPAAIGLPIMVHALYRHPLARGLR